ncbi:hypothetical protein D3C81_2195170 [compost metagenome]
MLVIENSADDACTPSHAARLMAAAVKAPQTHAVIKGANHYYSGQPDKAAESADVFVEWLNATF